MMTSLDSKIAEAFELLIFHAKFPLEIFLTRSSHTDHFDGHLGKSALQVASKVGVRMSRTLQLLPCAVRVCSTPELDLQADLAALMGRKIASFLTLQCHLSKKVAGESPCQCLQERQGMQYQRYKCQADPDFARDGKSSGTGYCRYRGPAGQSQGVIWRCIKSCSARPTQVREGGG